MWWRIKQFHFSCKAELPSAAPIWKKELFYFNYRGLPFNGYFFPRRVQWGDTVLFVQHSLHHWGLILLLYRLKIAVLISQDSFQHSCFHFESVSAGRWIKNSPFSTFSNQKGRQKTLKLTLPISFHSALPEIKHIIILFKNKNITIWDHQA